MKSCIRALWLAMSVCITLLATSATASAQIVVGHAIDLSGPNGAIGRDYVAGITTYFDSINVKGGINGKKIVYTVRDDRGVAADSAKLASSLIQQDRVSYLLGAIGPESTQAILAAPAFAESRHVLFAPLTDAFAAPRGRVIFWRPSMEHECQFILGYFDKLGLKKVGIVLQDTPQNQKTYKMVADELRKRGMTLSGTVRVSPNMDADARQLSASGAKVVLMIADTIGASQFLKAFRKHDASTFVAGTSLINLATLSEIAGARATEWTVFSQVVPNPGSTASVLQSEHIDMMKKFRDEPVSSITLEGFAVAKTLVKVIQMEAAGKGGLQTIAASRTPIDIGGMTIQSSDRKSTMSEFVDIALFKRDGRLMY